MDERKGCPSGTERVGNKCVSSNTNYQRTIKKMVDFYDESESRDINSEQALKLLHDAKSTLAALLFDAREQNIQDSQMPLRESIDYIDSILIHTY